MKKDVYCFMTHRELGQFDGRDGAPAYVAYEKRIYDVSKSFLWMKGSHLGVHHAGRDLTERMKEAPHGAEQLEKFPVIGYLVEESQDPGRAR